MVGFSRIITSMYFTIFCRCQLCMDQSALLEFLETTPSLIAKYFSYRTEAPIHLACIHQDELPVHPLSNNVGKGHRSYEVLHFRAIHSTVFTGIWLQMMFPYVSHFVGLVTLVGIKLTSHISTKSTYEQRPPCFLPLLWVLLQRRLVTYAASFLSWTGLTVPLFPSHCQ